eukprot:scaffold64079_cov54-Attheya_sp.AAC.3
MIHLESGLWDYSIVVWSAERCLATIGLVMAAISIASGLGFILGTSELAGLACPNSGLSQCSDGASLWVTGI